MKKINYLRVILGTMAMLLLFSSADAQNIVNSATGTITNAGVIRIKPNAGAFNNDAPYANITNTGTFEFQGSTNVFGGTVVLGSTSLLRVPGKVLYSGTLLAQAIPASYFTDLQMGGTMQKNYPAGSVFVSSMYDLAVGMTPTRNYGAGTFVYDGTLAQTILGENGAASNNNAYNNLTLMNAGTKTIAALTQANVVAVSALDATNTGGLTVLGKFNGGTDITQNAAAPIVLNDAAAIFNVGSGTNNFDGAINVTSGEFVVDGGAGVVTNINHVATGLALVDGTSKLTVTAANILTIAGTFTDAFAARTNLAFDPTSTVAYTAVGAQTMVGTVASNPYGNLTTTGAGLKTASAGFDVNMVGSLNVTGGDIDMYAAGNDRTLIMLNATKPAVYTAAEEVIGKMRRIGVVSLAPYTYNNTNTTVQFASGTFDAASYFEISSRTQTNPLAYDNTKDVNRKVVTDYNSATWNATIKIGYKTADLPGTWAAGNTEAQLRFYETDATIANIEKVATGSVYTRAPAPAGFVSLAGIQPTASATDGTSDEFIKAGNDIVLRGGPATFISVNNGRWSNPNTWDEGIQPSQNDMVLIKTTVHAGYTRQTDNFGTHESVQLTAYGGPNADIAHMAAKITIDNNIAGASLLFGGGGVDIWGINKTTVGVPNAGSITIGTLNGVANNIPANYATTLDDGASSSVVNGGLLLFQNATLLVNENLNNNGLITNGGTISLE